LKKAFTLLELVFVIVIIGILSAVAIPKFLNVKNHSVIESMSYTLTSGVKNATELALNYMYIEDNTSFKLNDVLFINELELVKNLKWNYTQSGSYNKDGTYSLRDEDYSTPAVVMRITLDLDERVIKYRIDCGNIKLSTHGDLRKLCAEKWGTEDIQGTVGF